MTLAMNERTAITMHAARLTEIPMSFLREGDRFVGRRGNVFVTGVADMDGHKVSSSYGTRTGVDVYDDREKNYINVQFDGVQYGPGTRFGVNTTMYERDDWKILVMPEVYNRYLEDKKWTPAVPTRVAEKQKLEDQLVRLTNELEEVRHAISNL